MTITPFAPRTPYIVVEAASFNTSIDEISNGLIPERVPPGPAAKGAPSTMNSGSVLEVNDEAPRICIARLPSWPRVTMMPGTFDIKTLSTDWPGLRSRSSDVTIDLPLGAGLLPPWFAPPLAHAETSPMSRLHGSTRRVMVDLI